MRSPRALAVGRRYTELEKAALRREVEEKTTPAAIQKRRKEMQSENMSKVCGRAETAVFASKVARCRKWRDVVPSD